MATLTEMLLKADAKKASKKATGTYKSHRLAMILGKKEPVEVTLTALDPERLTELTTRLYDKKGNVRYEKSFDVNTLICTDGITNPDVKSDDLIKHFNCKTPADLVVTLFGGEVSALAGKVIDLSGFSDEDTEDELKNS